MRRKHAALGCVSWRKEEVKDGPRVAAVAFVFNQTLVDDAAGGWVPQLTSLVLHKESLGDPLVDDNHSDLRLGRGLIVDLVDGSLKLRDLGRKHLVAHGIANTVTIDNEVGRKLIFVEVSEHLDCIFQCILHSRLHDLLSLLLNNVLRVVLAHLLIS